LQYHLNNDHIKEWSEELTKRGITVKAKAGLKALADYQGKPLDSQAPPRPSYSPELFVDTVVDFIVATDQVFFYFYFYFYCTEYFFSSLLALWITRNFVPFVFYLEKILRRKIYLIVPQLEQEFWSVWESILRCYPLKCR
jgi:hypothetical protein